MCQNFFGKIFFLAERKILVCLLIYRSFILLAPLLPPSVATLHKQGIQQMSDNRNKSNQNIKPYENIFPLKYILPKLMCPRAFYPKHKYGLVFDLWKACGGFLFPERWSPKSLLNVQNKVFHNLSHVLLFDLFPLMPLLQLHSTPQFPELVSVPMSLCCHKCCFLSLEILSLISQTGEPLPPHPFAPAHKAPKLDVFLLSLPVYNWTKKKFTL